MKFNRWKLSIGLVTVALVTAWVAHAQTESDNAPLSSIRSSLASIRTGTRNIEVVDATPTGNRNTSVRYQVIYDFDKGTATVVSILNGNLTVDKPVSLYGKQEK